MRVLKSSQGLAIIAVLAFAVYYWRFTHVSLYTGFSQDDLMNLYFAWREPWGDILKANFFSPTGTFRPFGTLFYRSVLELFGYEALPFRLICYVLLWVNVPVAYWFVKRVTGSREVGLIAALLHCVHANYFPLYYGSGNCYDLLAFLFFYLAFGMAIGPGPATWTRALAVAVLYGLALNSKEIAAPLPALLLAWLVLFRRPFQDLRFVFATGCIGVVFALGRFAGPDSLMTQPEYAPVLTVQRYLECTTKYLNELTAWNGWHPASAGYLLAGTLAIAVLSRNRVLLLSWLIVVVGSAPVAFIVPRGLVAYYLPLLGYAMYVAVALVRGREWIFGSRGQVVSMASQAALFTLLYVGLWRWNTRTERSLTQYWQEWSHIQTAVRDFRNHPEWFPRKGSLLLLDDPFGEWEWATTFIASVVGNTRDVQIHKYRKLEPRPTREQVATYTHVVTYDGSKYVVADGSTLP
jgi:hypothetical protein